jgi:hypothetical protein
MTPAADLPPDFLKPMAHEVRWRLVSALAASDRRVQELVTLLERPQNLVSEVVIAFYALTRLQFYFLKTSGQ